MKDNIEDLIKKSNPKVPDELKPDNIKLTKKKSFKPLVYALPVAAALALAIGLYTLPKKEINVNKKPTVQTKEDTTKDDKKESKEDTYHKAYLMFANSKGSNWGYKGIVYDAVSGIPETSVNEAMNSDKTSGSGYSQTNTRHEDVDEGTCVKTDGKYIYILDTRNKEIYINSAADGVTNKIATINTEFQAVEIYISGDRLIALGNNYDTETHEVMVKIYDISDKENITLVGNVVTTEGYYYSSRLVDGKLMLFSNVYKYRYYTVDIAEEDYESYIPTINGELVKAEDMVILPGCDTPDYTIIATVDISDASIVDNKAILGNGKLYVTNSNIYHISNYYEENAIGAVMNEVFGFYNNYYTDKLQIVKIAYTSDGILKDEVSGKCTGYINDDYSIDEYKGNLRLVANYYGVDDELYSALYVFDENLEIIGSIKNLAKGEKIRSARFMGDVAYFVTFRNMDPLFSVDLSDPKNPAIVGELKIPGFSSYLHPLDENHLVGIGYEYDEKLNFKGVKVSIYDITDKTDVKEEYKQVFDNIFNASPINNPNNFLIDTDRKFMGFSVSASVVKKNGTESAIKNGEGYIIISYDENGMEIKNFKENSIQGMYYETYGLYIDDYIYIVETSGEISSVKISEM